MARRIFWDDRSQEQYNCEDCGRGIDEIHGKFEVHHKDGNPYNNDPENLVGLCKACHAIREDRKPGKNSIYNILHSFKKQKGDTNGGNAKVWLFGKELMRHFPTGSILRKLGYSREERKQGFKPKTRREAAIYEQGWMDHAGELYDDVVCEKLTQVGGDLSCARCGDSDNALEVLPSETYGDLEDRLPFCVFCEKRLFDSIDGMVHDDKIASKMEQFASTPVTEPGLEDCEVCGSERDANLIHSYHDGSEIAICQDCESDPADVWWKNC
jgi:hypothetical protein